MSYVDGFVLPVPKKNLPAYLKMARTASKVWKDHGALESDFGAACNPATFLKLTPSWLFKFLSL